MGVILTMTMVMITGLAITRERERGTMENLLATPATALEVMIGKIVPYILIGYVQVTLILLLARFLFDVPMIGSLVAALWRGAALHRRQPGAGHHVLDARAKPAAGDADDVLLLPAVDPAVRLHVSVPRHAGLGAVDRRSACRSRTSCASSAASCSRATASPRMPEIWPLLVFMLVVMLLGLRTFRSTLDWLQPPSMGSGTLAISRNERQCSGAACPCRLGARRPENTGPPLAGSPSQREGDRGRNHAVLEEIRATA